MNDVLVVLDKEGINCYYNVDRNKDIKDILFDLGYNSYNCMYTWTDNLNIQILDYNDFIDNTKE